MRKAVVREMPCKQHLLEGYNHIVERLLAYGADANAQGGYCGNALQAASSKGHDQIVERLLAHGADVNAQTDTYYRNALYAASYKGHNQIVERLLAHGADVVI
jgi:ankyrin repeat protein